MGADFRLVDETTGVVIAHRVSLADDFFGRFRGMMLKRNFLSGEALLFTFGRPGRKNVHTFFVRFPIDLVYLDSGFRIVEVRPFLSPWRLHRSKVTSSHLIELPAGTVLRLGIGLGDRIVLEKGF
ncbi:MAG: DUF192 domain-containing protein [Candidatus Hadarchaeaceae archaeon]